MRFIQLRAVGPRKHTPSSFTTTSFPREGTSRPGNNRATTLKSSVPASSQCVTRREGSHALSCNKPNETKEKCNEHYPLTPDNNLNPRTVHSRADRLWSGSFKALWQQRGRVPHSASAKPHRSRCYRRLGRRLGTPALRLVRSQPRHPHHN